MQAWTDYLQGTLASAITAVGHSHLGMSILLFRYVVCCCECRETHRALQDNAFLLVLQSRNIHDNLHHAVLEPKGHPNTAQQQHTYTVLVTQACELRPDAYPLLMLFQLMDRCLKAEAGTRWCSGIKAAMDRGGSNMK